jgi:glutamate/tyrosine decarboxylase-like PLP-dependent enzyme
MSQFTENQKEKLTSLKQKTAALQPDSAVREELEKAAGEYADRFYKGIKTGKAYQAYGEEIKDKISIPVPETGVEMRSIIDVLENEYIPPGLNVASGRHFGYIPGGGIHSAAIADYLAAVTNRYAGVFASSPGAVVLEANMVRWLCAIIGYGEGSGGYLSSGGSIANMTAVVAARDNSGCRAEAYHKMVVYLSSQTHHCVDRALNIAGMGECVRRDIPLDDHYRMRPDELRKAIQQDREKGLIPWMVVASAGSTDTGAVDPLDKLSEICSEHNLWYHVDAAYGGFFILTDEGQQILSGIEKSDSAVLDPHKGMFLPYGTGALLVKDVEKLAASHRYEASYMKDTKTEGDFYSPADISPELSKHFRALRMWLPLQLHGVSTFRDALQEKLQLADYLWSKFEAMDEIEVSPKPQLSIFMFRWTPAAENLNELNRELHKKMVADGRVFLSTTEISGEFYFRVAVLSVRTHVEEADELLKTVKRLIKELKVQKQIT